MGMSDTIPTDTVYRIRSGYYRQPGPDRQQPETKDIAADLGFYGSTPPPSTILTNISAGPNIYSDVDI